MSKTRSPTFIKLLEGVSNLLVGNKAYVLVLFLNPFHVYFGSKSTELTEGDSNLKIYLVK